MSNFPLTDMALKMFCPGNVAQLDDAGLPSVLVWIPAFKLSDVLNTTDDSTHPAFIVNGREIPGFYYSKYQNVVHNGRAYSLPGEDPKVAAKFDDALEYSDAKGYGWHMSTAAEWAAIALWCKKNGWLPYGNNKSGKDSRESSVKAIPTDYGSDGSVTRVATGTGPLTWSHDKTMSGIWDLNGNTWEWQGGFRLVWGELQILANNDAADLDNPQNTTSVCWKAISAADGSLVNPECSIEDTSAKSSGNTVKLDYLDNVWTYSTGISSAIDSTRACDFGSVACTAGICEAAKLLLRALALLPDDGADVSGYEGDKVFWNNSRKEMIMSRSGHYGHGSGSGLFYVGGGNPRDYVSWQMGFRASYIPNI